ncbi:MAG: transglutaminase family protein [Verrucomicrobiota bacterium]|nr:transglutaminase family protein [Verrucomicrobiota bacterium]
MRFFDLRSPLGQSALLFAVLGLFAAGTTMAAKELPSPDPLDAKNLAKRIRESIVVLTQFGRDDEEEGVGTGFVVSSDGLIATSLHVAGEGRPVRVRLANGESAEVTSVHAWDRALDLAVLRIDQTGLRALPLGDSDTLEQGASVVAMGTPHGLEFSFVQGVVSARRDFDGVGMIQLAVPIEPGNSGGPMLDLYGRVHGVITMKSLVTENLGFALPSNLLKPLLEKPNPVPIGRWITIGRLDPKEWIPVFGGHWRQKGGKIHVTHPGDSFGGRALCLSTRAVPETPFELSVQVKLGDESGAAGLVWAADGGNKHYGFYPTAGQMRLTRFDGANVFSWTILEQQHTRHYMPGDWNTLKLRHEGNRFYCHVNGHLVFESADRGLTEGKVGLAKFRDTVAIFRNFRLGQQVADETAPIDGPLGEALLDEAQANGGPLSEPTLAGVRKHPVQARRHLEQEAKRLEEQAAQLRLASTRLHRRLVRDRLEALFENGDDADLFRAALLLAKLDDPEVDIAHYEKQLNAMAAEVKARFEGREGEPSKLKKVIAYLFEENGYHGSRQDYYNRANSYMNRVLDDREGLPIMLSVLVMELAAACGIDGVAGVGAPGHFIVRHLIGETEQFIDPFDSGHYLTRAEAEQLVSTNTGRSAVPEDLTMSTDREIVLRMLRNLMGAVPEDGSPTELLRYIETVVALQPDSAFDRWSRAVLLIQTRQYDPAKKDLEWLLQTKPTGLDLERVLQLYQSLQ